MNITSDTTLVGYPILKIRQLLRAIRLHWHGKGMIYILTTNITADNLDITEEEAQGVLNELVSLGYLSRIDNSDFYPIEPPGNALRCASAARPIHRKTADKVLHQFLERVQQVNSDPYYLYKVREVQVFGSYLSDKQRISDVDVAVDIQPKFEYSRQRELEEERIRLAYRKGRQFRNYNRELEFPRNEVEMFLRNRSHSLSIHKIHEPQGLGAIYKVIYTENE